MTLRRALQLFIALAVGAGCLFLAFRGVIREEDGGIGAVVDKVLSVPLWGLLTFLVLFALQGALRTERFLLQARRPDGQKPPRKEAYAVNAVGFAAVFLLPFRLGELVRPNLSGSHGIMPSSAGLAVSAVERVVDGMVMTGCFGLVILLMHGEVELPAYVKVGGVTAALLFSGAFVGFVVAFRFREASLRLLERVVSVVHGGLARRLVALGRGFLDGLACLRGGADVALYLGLTVVYWAVNGLSMWLFMVAMGIDAPLLCAFFALCFLVVGMMMPAPPGNVGNFHAFISAALGVFGVSAVSALGYAIALHAVTTVAVLLYAGAFMAFGGVKLAGAVRAQPPTSSAPARAP